MEKIEKTLPKAPAWEDFPDIELYMDQVISVLERYLTPYFEEEKCITSTMINNYVKQKLLSPPRNKRYGRAQLARLFMIGILKSFMQLSDLCTLLDHLAKAEGEQALYNRFSEALNLAVEGAFSSLAPSEYPEEPSERALHAALASVAAIHRARLEFRCAARVWEAAEPCEPKEKKDKKEKKKA